MIEVHWNPVWHLALTEEREATAQFGEEYSRYAAVTLRFLLGWFGPFEFHSASVERRTALTGD